MEEHIHCWVCNSSSVQGQRLHELGGGRRATGREMMEYCLDIHLDDKIAANVTLCAKCSSKLASFYKFKRLARDSLTLLHDGADAKCNTDVDAVRDGKTEKYLDLKNEVKEENTEVKSEEEVLAAEVKQEIEFGDVEFVNDSDDELLSVLTLNNNKIDETVSTVKRKRGRPKSMKKHKSPQTEGVCDHCGKNVRCLRTHLKLHQPDGSRKRVPCKLCDKTFATLSSRYRHNKIKHLGIKEFCAKCNKAVCDLRQHDMMIHNPEKLPMLCIVCGRRFASQSTLDQHMTAHTRLKQHECPDCGELFRLKITMLNHKRRIHDGEKSHLCQYCSKGFFKKYHLIMHLRLHTNERPLECNECGKKFRCSSSLHVHLKRHRGLRDHACTVCDMAFYNAGALSVHMVSHTKERRYACSYCDAKFGRSDHRNRHQRTAHNKPPATCSAPAPAPAAAQS